MPISVILEESDRSQSFIDLKAQIDSVLMMLEDSDLRFCLSLVKIVSERGKGRELE
jgi:hypothetical protein